jgi:2-methylcitrate dehydratase PrpD
MALGLFCGGLTAREYEGTPWETPEVKALMARIELVEDPEMNRAFDTLGILGVRLVADLLDGTTEEIVVHQPKGHPDSPLTEAALLEKVTWLLDGLAPAQTPRQLLDLCNHLVTAKDVEQLVEACAVTPT